MAGQQWDGQRASNWLGSKMLGHFTFGPHFRTKSSWRIRDILSMSIDARTRTLYGLSNFSRGAPARRPDPTATLLTSVCSRGPPCRGNPVPARGAAACLGLFGVSMRGMTAVFCIGVFDSLKGVCTFVLLLPEAFTSVAVG